MLGGCCDGQSVGVPRIAAAGVTPERWLTSQLVDARQFVVVHHHQLPRELEEAGDLCLPECVDALLDVSHIADRWLPRGVRGAWLALVHAPLTPQPREQPPLQWRIVLSLVDDEGPVASSDCPQQFKPALKVGADGAEARGCLSSLAGVSLQPFEGYECGVDVIITPWAVLQRVKCILHR